MSECGIAGMTGRRPSAGWMPACWKPYQLRHPAKIYGQKPSLRRTRLEWGLS